MINTKAITQQTPSSKPIKWHPPAQGYYKLNCDGASTPSTIKHGLTESSGIALDAG